MYTRHLLHYISAIFGALDKSTNQNVVLLNHLLLIFKLNVYNSRNNTFCFNISLRYNTKVKKMQKKTNFSITNENNPLPKKWKIKK